MSAIKRITFVWNADFSLASGARALKEAIEGQHSCSLCEIAYHRVTQTRDWKSYKQELTQRLDADIREPCRNQLKQEEITAAARDFPAVLAHTRDGVIKLLGGERIDGCDGDFPRFKALLDNAIQKYLESL